MSFTKCTKKIITKNSKSVVIEIVNCSLPTIEVRLRIYLLILSENRSMHVSSTFCYLSKTQVIYRMRVGLVTLLTDPYSHSHKDILR
jgi:hypothetical protein